MSTTPITLASATSTPISLDDPRLNISELSGPDAFSPVTLVETGTEPCLFTLTPKCPWKISGAYSNLHTETKKGVLTLWDRDAIAAAQRLADCGRFGSVYKRCKKKKIARAHRHTCHMWICHYCGLAHNLLHCWLRSRSPEVGRERQVGLELIGPLGADLEGVARKLSLYFQRQGVDSVRRVVVDPAPKAERIRMVLHTAKLEYRSTLEYVRKIAGVGYSIQPKRESNPTLLLKWMFAATEPILAACGHIRAQAFMAWQGRRLMKTTGRFYSPAVVIPEDSLLGEDERFPGEEDDPSNHCPCGACDGVMEDVPAHERFAEPCDRIESAYEHVDWSSCYNPFLSYRVSYNPPLVANYRAPTADPQQHAPPPS